MSSQPSCDQCGSTEFRLEDGIIVCEQGHHQEGGQRIGEDDGDYHAAGRVSRKKTERSKEKIIRVYRGPKGYRLFLKAWQFILWKQCHVMVQKLDLPDEIWNIVKELWALRLTQLTNRIEDILEVEETQQSTDAGRAELVRESTDEPQQTTKNTTITDNPTLWDTVALNYLGILILRRPIALATIYDLIRDEEICFIRAIRHVPGDIRERLAPEYREALDTTTIPKQQNLCMAIHRIVTMYSAAFGMVTPPLNYTPILLANIRQLSLPLEVFPAAKYISKTVDFTFTYLRSCDTRKNATSLPEAQLMASIIVATKLLFPFSQVDTPPRPHTWGEPAALKMDWDAWLEDRMESEQDEEMVKPLKPREAIQITDRDVIDMNVEQLDQYMDWFQSTYVVEVKNTSNINKQILDMFPLADLPMQSNSVAEREDSLQQQVAQRLSLTQSRLTPVQPVTDIDAQATESHISRPGRHHHRFRHVSDLSGPAAIFHREAAEMACLSLDELLRAVWRTERLLLLTQVERRRAEEFEEDLVSEHE